MFDNMTSTSSHELIEAVTDAEYLEITRSEEYDTLMDHCERVITG